MGREHAIMTQQLLDKPDVSPGFQEMSGITVAQGMDPSSLPDTSLFFRFLEHLLRTPDGINAAAGALKQVLLRPELPKILTKLL
jgi:hypothetical protein